MSRRVLGRTFALGALLTAIERRRMEQELSALERELPELEARMEGARAAYALAQDCETERRAWSAYLEIDAVHEDALTRARELRERLAEDEQRAIERTHGPEVRR